MPRQDEIRLNGTSYAVLGLVRYLGRATPYDLKRLLAESVENFWPVPHTTFYAEPARLAQAGYLLEEQEQRGRRRKLYELTDKGRKALERWVLDTDAAPPVIRDEGVLKVFLGADPLAVFHPRITWHREKLAELDGYLQGISAQLEQLPRDMPERIALEGARSSLVAGTSWHRMNIALIEQGLRNAPG